MVQTVGGWTEPVEGGKELPIWPGLGSWGLELGEEAVCSAGRPEGQRRDMVSVAEEGRGEPRAGCWKQCRLEVGQYSFCSRGTERRLSPHQH